MLQGHSAQSIRLCECKTLSASRVSHVIIIRDMKSKADKISIVVLIFKSASARCLCPPRPPPLLRIVWIRRKFAGKTKYNNKSETGRLHLQSVLFVSDSDGCVQVNKWGRNRCRGEIIDVIGPLSYLVNAGRPVMSVDVVWIYAHLPENPKQTFFFASQPVYWPCLFCCELLKIFVTSDLVDLNCSTHQQWLLPLIHLIISTFKLIIYILISVKSNESKTVSSIAS